MDLTPSTKYHDDTVRFLVEQGCEQQTAEDIFSSGYIWISSVPNGLLDTYYELSVDVQDVLKQISLYPPLETKVISSLSEAQSCLEKVQKALGPNGMFTFRGVNKEYFLDRTTGRKYISPIVPLSNGKEISCIPSGYRTCITEDNLKKEGIFSTIFASELQYDGIDLAAQVEKNAERGLYSISDLEDDSDPVNKEIYKRIMNRLYFKDESVLFAQHYGIPTSALDVTFDISIALFFASHKFQKLDNGKTTYIKNPTSESAVYCFWHEPAELAEQGRVRNTHLYSHIGAIRPLRQDCALIRHSPLAVNKSAAYIVFRMKLNEHFNFTGIPTIGNLFPNPENDPFYKKLLELKHKEEENTPDNLKVWKDVYELEY